jgi:hypothetical protein
LDKKLGAYVVRWITYAITYMLIVDNLPSDDVCSILAKGPTSIFQESVGYNPPAKSAGYTPRPRPQRIVTPLHVA